MERERGGWRETSECTGEGVTYEVTQNGFWTVGARDEEVALVSLRLLLSDSSRIRTEMITRD